MLGMTPTSLLKTLVLFEMQTQAELCSCLLMFHLCVSTVPAVSREGDTFVSTSIEQAIRTVDSAIESTRRRLFDG